MKAPTRPTRDGEYPAHVSRLAAFDIDGPIVSITNLRDGLYPEPDVAETRWIDTVFDTREITNVYFYAAYFGRRFKGLAHTMFGFEFSDGRVIAPSFEIRPNVGQRYTPMQGAKKSYELMSMWMTERDAILSRVMRSALDSRIHMFEGTINHQRSVELFDTIVRRTTQLHEEPEWYHTTFNSCSTNSVAVINEATPGSVKWSPRNMAPGYVPKLWTRKGLLKLNGTYEATLESTYVNDRAMEIGFVDDFSPRLHGR